MDRGFRVARLLGGAVLRFSLEDPSFDALDVDDDTVTQHDLAGQPKFVCRWLA